MTLPRRAATGAAPASLGAAGVADGVIALRGASVRRGRQIIWSDVSLNIARGEFVAVLGANGAGKSTLLQVILGLLPLASGSVAVLGGPPGESRGQVGYLPQRHGVEDFARIRGIDVVRLGLDGARWGLPRPRLLGGGRADADRVQEVLELVNADAYATRPIGELSGGQQQRLLIAQALVRRPQILMLDEPLDSLDPASQAAVAALVQRLCHSEGVAVLLVAHDANPFLSYLSRIVYFAGQTAVVGAPREVITSETLTRLYGAPIEVLQTSDGRLVVVGQPEAPHVHSHRHRAR